MSGSDPSAGDPDEPTPDPAEPGWAPYQPPVPPGPVPPPQGWGYGPPPGQPQAPSPYSQAYGQPYGQPYGAYGAPYGVHPVSGEPYGDKSKNTAGLLQLLLSLVGICGVGRLYAGHVGIGLTQLIGMFVAFCASAGIIGIPFVIGIYVWSIVDGIIMLSSTGNLRDGQGRLLRS